MDGVLSQEEINALLNDTNSDSDTEESIKELTAVEIDAIGEVSNISMGTSATTLSSLVNRKVDISTPVVEYITWDEIVDDYERPCVFIRIAYTHGLDGSNIMVLKENDVKVITDLMMGGDGSNTDGELGELHLSAICEAMNQMMGSSATSLSSMLNKAIDISPPSADIVDFTQKIEATNIDDFLKGKFVRISFKMEIGNLVDSEIMQLYPYSFAKEMYENMALNMKVDLDEEEKTLASNIPKDIPQQQNQPIVDQPTMNQQQIQPNLTMNQQQIQPNLGMAQQQMQPNMDMNQQQLQSNMGIGQMQNNMGMNQQQMQMNYTAPQHSVNVQNAQFQNFSPEFMSEAQKENIDLIMDVPLEVTVELGRTRKSIKDILEFSPGTIIELDKIAGEPIDVLVNGKYVATGEVVVIEENFGIRITDIIKDN